MKKQGTPEDAVAGEPPKFDKPKILIIDEEPDVPAAVREWGFNVETGSFGTPFNVAPSDQYIRIKQSSDLPVLNEMEIVFINLFVQPTSSAADVAAPASTKGWYVNCQSGVVDPRPLRMRLRQEALERIFDHGGAFIVFTDAPEEIDLIIGSPRGYGGGFDGAKEFSPSTWDFLPDVRNNFYDPAEFLGAEIQLPKNPPPIARKLQKFLTRAMIGCTFRPCSNAISLAENKYGVPVAGMLQRKSGGVLLMLPMIVDKIELYQILLNEVLPELCPHLFPHITEGRWASKPIYQPSLVQELEGRKQKVIDTAKQEVEQLDAEIQKEQEKSAWKKALLTAYDDALVKAVQSALAACGFQKVVDVDAIQDAEGKPRREDLQIHDRSPVLIVDVKGVGGFPEDAEALQADKHATIRMREWSRVDVNGLTIVNHQRHLEPLSRQNEMPFRQEIIDAALPHNLGLLTTWDLYRLVRNIERYQWLPEHVQPIFFRKGRIEIIPEHYSFVGRVAKFWPKANGGGGVFGVVMENGELVIGDAVAVEFEIEFEEVTVSAMHVKNAAVERAVIGDPVGLPWNRDDLKPREGMRVFKVTTPQELRPDA